MEGGSKDVRVNIQEESGPDGLLAMKSSIINTVILQQQKRIAELENELQRSRQEVQRIKRSSGSMVHSLGERKRERFGCAQSMRTDVLGDFSLFHVHTL